MLYCAIADEQQLKMKQNNAALEAGFFIALEFLLRCPAQLAYRLPAVTAEWRDMSSSTAHFG